MAVSSLSLEALSLSLPPHRTPRAAVTGGGVCNQGPLQICLVFLKNRKVKVGASFLDSVHLSRELYSSRVVIFPSRDHAAFSEDLN